jgi:hypothetical protein
MAVSLFALISSSKPSSMSDWKYTDKRQHKYKFIQIKGWNILGNPREKLKEERLPNHPGYYGIHKLHLTLDETFEITDDL